MKPWACDYHRAREEGRDFQETKCRFFEIGPGRTATRSVYSAVKKLGYTAVHGTGGCSYCTPEMMEEMERDGIDMPMYKTYDYCGHLPIYHWEQLAIAYPESKFILTLRPIDEWVKSAVKRMGRGGKRKYKRSEYIHIRCFGSKKPSRQQLQEGFTKHRDKVIDYFRSCPDRLLILNVFEDTDRNLWEALSEFMGVECNVSKPFPRKITPVNMFKGKGK